MRAKLWPSNAVAGCGARLFQIALNREAFKRASGPGETRGYSALAAHQAGIGVIAAHNAAKAFVLKLLNAGPAHADAGHGRSKPRPVDGA